MSFIYIYIYIYIKHRRARFKVVYSHSIEMITCWAQKGQVCDEFVDKCVGPLFFNYRQAVRV